MSIESFKTLARTFYENMDEGKFNLFLSRRVENEYRKLSAQELVDIHTLIGKFDLSKTRFPFVRNHTVEDVLDIYATFYDFTIRTKRDNIGFASRTGKTVVMDDFERAAFDGNVAILVANNLGKKLHELEHAEIPPAAILSASAPIRPPLT